VNGGLIPLLKVTARVHVFGADTIISGCGYKHGKTRGFGFSLLDHMLH
jgi:hypothetical protein